MYISDLHGNQFLPQFAADCDSRQTRSAAAASAISTRLRIYNQAFGVFFKRLAADGITPKNTLFVVSSDEGDHEAGANVGRALSADPRWLRRCHRDPCNYTLGGLRRDRRRYHRPAVQRDRQHHAVQPWRTTPRPSST